MAGVAVGHDEKTWPLNHVTLYLAGQVTQKIAKFLPRVTCESVTISPGAPDRLLNRPKEAEKLP